MGREGTQTGCCVCLLLTFDSSPTAMRDDAMPTAGLRPTETTSLSETPRAAQTEMPPAGRSVCLLDLVPPVVWVEHVLPFLDRPSWNSLQASSRGVHRLLSQAGAGVATAPPWPERCFSVQASSSSVESFTISADGEYLACGTAIGSIEVWSRRSGRLQLNRPRAGADGNRGSGRGGAYGGPPPSPTGSQVRRCAPVGSCLKFAPVGHTLACGFENRIFLWRVSSDARRHRQQQQQQQDEDQTRRSSDSVHAPSPPFKVLEIECHHGTIYEVTYLGFSADATRLVARYGKAAYIWNLTHPPYDHGHGPSPPLPAFRLTHRIPLNSSRCQMSSSPCLLHLAVTNASSSDDKGMIDVWDLRPLFQRRRGSSSLNGSNSGNDSATPPLALESSSTCRIPAYDRRSVIRGLEFASPGGRRGIGCQEQDQQQQPHWLVSASLQGEIKFWAQRKDPHHRAWQDGGNACGGGAGYACIYTFQSPGKIFSMALSPAAGGDHAYLAVGQARGQVRVWKVPRLEGGAVGGCDRDIGRRGGRPDAAAERVLIAAAGRQNKDVDLTSSDSSRSMDMDEYLAADIGEHSHHDNIKLISFTPDGRSLAASRAYDAKIWFQTFRH